MKRRYKTTLRILAIAVPAVIILPIIWFVVWWHVTHRPRLINETSNSTYKISVYYYPGGLGTNPDIGVFSVDVAGHKQLLVSANDKDTASGFFIDSVTAGIVIYDRAMVKPWSRFPKDTFYFRLDEEIKPIELGGN